MAVQQFSDLNSSDLSFNPSYEAMKSYTQQNYSIAAQWYSQRKAAFETALLHDYQMKITNFTDDIKSFAEKWVKNVQGPVLAAVNGYAPAGTDEVTELSLTRDEIISQIGIGNHNFVRAVTLLGNAYEKMLGQHPLSNGQIAAIGDFKQQAVDGVIAQLGSLTNASALTGGRATATRIDIAYMAKGSQPDKNNQLELTTLIDIQDIATQIGLTDTQSMLETLVNSATTGAVNMDIYGFQVKTYKDFDDKRWSQGAEAAQAINALMAAFRNGKTWSSVYAAEYPTYFLSRFLLNIIAPNNIGIISKNGIVFMDEFLHTHQFYMEVASTGPANPEPSTRPSGHEIFPTVVGNTILIKQVGLGGSISLTQYKNNTLATRTTRQHFAKDDPRRKIKVLSVTHTISST